MKIFLTIYYSRYRIIAGLLCIMERIDWSKNMQFVIIHLYDAKRVAKLFCDYSVIHPKPTFIK